MAFGAALASRSRRFLIIPPFAAALKASGRRGNGGKGVVPDFRKPEMHTLAFLVVVEPERGARLCLYRAAHEVQFVREHEAVLCAGGFALGLVNEHAVAELPQQVQQARAVVADVAGIVDYDV